MNEPDQRPEGDRAKACDYPHGYGEARQTKETDPDVRFAVLRSRGYLFEHHTPPAVQNQAVTSGQTLNTQICILISKEARFVAHRPRSKCQGVDLHASKLDYSCTGRRECSGAF